MNHSQVTTIAAVAIMLMSVVAPIGIAPADAQDAPDSGQIADANIDVADETVAPGETTEVVVTFEAAASDFVTADTLGSPGAVAPAKNNSDREPVTANNTSIASIAESELTIINTTPQASNTQSDGPLFVRADWQNPDSGLTTYELRSEFTVSDTASDGETISFDSLINADSEDLLTDPVQVTVEEDSGSTDPPTEGEVENAAINVTDETVAPGETTEIVVTFEAAASNTVAADTLGSPGAVAPTESSEDRDLVNSNNTSTASIAESELSIVDTTPQASNTENPAPLGVQAEWQNPDSSLTTYELRSELAVSDTATDGETISFDSQIIADSEDLLTDSVQVTVDEDSGSTDPPTEGEIENAAIDVTEETVAPGETTEVIVTFEAAASNTVAADTLGSPGAVAPTESSEDRDLVNSNNTSTASIAESELSIVDTTPQASNTENPAPLGVQAEWQNPDSSLTTYELRSELAVSDTATDGETITFDSAIEADGNGLLTDPVQVTVEEDGGSDDPVPDPGTGEVAATLEPTAPQVGLGGESTVELVVTGPDAGVGSYEFTVSVGDASTVEIADIQEANTGGTGEVNLASDGSSVSVNRALLGDTIAPTDAVVLATLTVSGEAAGTTDLTVEEVIVGDEGGNSYDVVGTGAATLEVTEGVDVTGDGNPATDTTGDGKLNDIDGDGEANILDVQAFFNSLDDEAVQNNPELFDFNGDGEVSIIDVQALFNQNT